MKWKSLLYLFTFVDFHKPKHYLSYSKAKHWLHHEGPRIIAYGNVSSNYELNCEHVIPKFVLRKHQVAKASHSDLHLLLLCNPRLNSHRQHFKFDMIQDTESSNIGLTKYGYECPIEDAFILKNNKTQRFQPPVDSRGVIARIVGYYYFTYEIDEDSRLLELKQMKQWHKDYPVTKEEKERNIAIHKIQRNKNIFISYPFLLPFYFSTIFQKVFQYFRSLQKKKIF